MTGLSEVSSRQITQWLEYYRLEPFGETRNDWRMGVICALIANIYRDKDKRLEPYKPSDFMPDEQKQKQQTPGDMLNLAREITLAMGGTINTD